MSEIWTSVQESMAYVLFTLNDAPITLFSLTMALIIIGVFLFFSRLARRGVQKLLPKIKVDNHSTIVASRIVQAVVFFSGFVLALDFVGLPISGFSKVLTFELFRLNEVSVSLSSLLTFIALVGFFIILAKAASRTLVKVMSETQVEQGTNYVLGRITQYIVVLIGLGFAFQFIGINLSGLAVIFGFLSVGIGFGLQNITSNFISGLILLFERPIKVGDRVTVGDTDGDVLEINIRSTTVRTLNNISIIVPNSEFISSNVINWSHGDLKIRLDIPIGVSYDSDLDLVLKSLEEVADADEEVMKKPAPEILFEEFGDSSWNLNLRIWIRNPKRHQQVRSNINCAIVRKFREHDIEIPFPQRDLHVRSPLPVPLSSLTKNAN